MGGGLNQLWVDLNPKDDIDIALSSNSMSNSVDFTHAQMSKDWESRGKEEWIQNSVDHLVFAPVPSEEEVEEATKDLQVALDRSEECVVSDEKKECVVVNKERREDNAFSSNMALRLGLLQGHSSSVHQAFNLMKTNPKVQEAVKSLARDPTVWSAVLSNEKVMELARGLQDNDVTVGQRTSFCHKNDPEEFNITMIASKVCDFVSGTVSQIVDKVVEVVGSIFTSLEQSFVSARGTNNIDKTLASSMMLAVVVLLVVVIKRAAVK